MYRIVIIDDEYIVVEGIKAIIKKQKLDCEVVGAANDGIDGFEAIRQNRPDLVLTDIRMPGLDGLSLIEMVKEEFPDIRFIVISGYTEFEYTKRAISLGVKDYIDKPITMEKLKEVMTRLHEEDVNQSYETNFLDVFLGKMMDDILKKEPDMLMQQCDLYFSQLPKYRHNLEVCKRYCFRLLCVLLEVLADQKHNYEDWMHVSYQEIEKLESYQEVKTFTYHRMKKIASSIMTEHLGTNHYIIKQLLQYIEENYHRDIGLTELAEEVGMNPTYLCILFKDEVGTSYVKYLTSLRIKKAKEFLKEGYKVSEVSVMVGYHNYRYFCNIFKKQLGKTPNEYKGGIRKKHNNHKKTQTN